MIGIKILVNVIISATVLMFVAGCSSKPGDCPQRVQSSRTLRPLISQRLETMDSHQLNLCHIVFSKY